MRSESLPRSSWSSALHLDLSDSAFQYLLTLLFFCLTLWGILHHEMWRDELQAWLVARDSSSLLDLVHNVRYERTPALWQACLYGLNYLTHNPIAMQAFHLAIATASIFLFAKYSPFTKLQKFMFTFGYLPFYEYGVISRSYALGVLLIFITCVLLTRPVRNYFAVALTLGLLANTSVYGLIVAVAFSLAILLDLISTPGHYSAFHRPRIVGAAVLLFVCLMVSTLQLIPPADYVGYISPLHRETPWDRMVQILLQVWGSHIAIPDVFRYSFWNRNILEALPEKIYVRTGVLLSLGFLVSEVLFFYRKPKVLLLYLAGTGAIIWFGFAEFTGNIRNNGYLFVLLITCLWLSEFNDESEILKFGLKSFDHFLSRYRVTFLNTLLFVHLIGGVFAMSMEIGYPFSETRAVASFVAANSSEKTVLAGTDFMGSPLTAYSNKKCYMLERGVFGTFMIWDNKRVKKDSDDTLKTLKSLIDSGTEEVVFVSKYQLEHYSPNLDISELAEFTQSFNGDTFYIYRVRKPER
jgi:hypothetical protein